MLYFYEAKALFAMDASENECVIRGVYVFVRSTVVATIRKAVSTDEGSLGCAIVHLVAALASFENFPHILDRGFLDYQ